jgi:hypothetical protein
MALPQSRHRFNSSGNVMPKQYRLAALPLALTMLVASQSVSYAQLAPLYLLDQWIKKSNKEAQAIPEHVQWCLEHHPGYRPQWNNWRTANGRVAYCASPYYTPPWQAPFAGR